MTDIVDPSLDREPDADRTARVIKWAGGADPGWVIPASETFLGDEYSGIDETVLNAFASSHSSTSLTVTIDAGAGFIGGAYCARDITTDVALASSTTGQTVYVGYQHESNNTLTLGLDGDFANTDSRIPLHTYDTDGSGVTSHTDERADDYRIQSADVEALVTFEQGDRFSDYPINQTDIVDGQGSGLDADYWRGNTPENLREPIYGDGSDGSITRSTNSTEDGTIFATDYTVESGVTRTVSNGVLIVHATNKIEINGTIDASGTGAAGGAGGSVPGGNGATGDAADYVPTTAGSGGTITGAGDGGDSGVASSGQENRDSIRAFAGGDLSLLYDLVALAGAGGGGGGAGDDATDTDSAGADGSGGGGGSGATEAGSITDSDKGAGGAGGAGGGAVVLIAPIIEINGSIIADGADGNPGEDATTVGGGGGGGGAGGLIAVIGRWTSGLANTSVAGGLGGSGGAASQNGGNGGDGQTGVVLEVATN